MSLFQRLKTQMKDGPLARPLLVLCLVTGLLFALSQMKNRAGTSEAKRYLTELALAERAHFKKWQRYELDLEKIGFKLDGNQLQYVISFIPSCAAKHGVLETSVTSSLDFASRGIASTVTHSPILESDLERVQRTLEEYKSFRCPHPLEGFVAMAIGNIDGDPELDVWIIDESNDLQHLQSDL